MIIYVFLKPAPLGRIVSVFSSIPVLFRRSADTLFQPSYFRLFNTDLGFASSFTIFIGFVAP
jgi:hypothetical protein